MPKRQGKYTIIFENKPCIESYASVCGKKEGEGPLKAYFDKIYQDTIMGKSSWEKAESKMQEMAVKLALDKGKLNADDINYIFAGDLLNQCISSTFALKDLNVPYLGLFGACSTMAESLCMASLFIESKCANRCIAVTSSHFCSAERQFRFPLEYGGQRTPTAQWTVTASGAVVVSEYKQNLPYVKAMTIGKICDMNIKDTNNMGAAMAPAAYDTIKNYLDDTNTKAEEYDIILTGDLGLIGSKLLHKLFLLDGIDISKNHKDCGIMIFDIDKQDVHAGGSGCGCCAAVLCSYILNEFKKTKLNNILFVGTGALMSPTSSQQGESIPGVAHLLNIKNS